MQDIWLLIVGAGLSLFGAAVTQLLIVGRESWARRATVRDSAYKEIVEACAEFVSASHLNISRSHDVIFSLSRAKAQYPHADHLGGYLDKDSMHGVFQPAIERYLAATVRAEVLAFNKDSTDCIQRMQDISTEVVGMINDAVHGQFSPDWESRLRQLVSNHDQESNKLVGHLRQFGARTTYRNL